MNSRCSWPFHRWVHKQNRQSPIVLSIGSASRKRNGLKERKGFFHLGNWTKPIVVWIFAHFAQVVSKMPKYQRYQTKTFNCWIRARWSKKFWKFCKFGEIEGGVVKKNISGLVKKNAEPWNAFPQLKPLGSQGGGSGASPNINLFSLQPRNHLQNFQS